jgi:dTDP-4-dehydrorhamnose reductase
VRVVSRRGRHIELRRIQQRRRRQDQPRGRQRFAVRSLGAAAADATLVHYSTDFVFDGATSTPYQETDPPAPQSTYAASKLLGEWFATDAPRALVLRVESLFGVPGGRPPGRWTIVAASGRPRGGGADGPRVSQLLRDVAAATRHGQRRAPGCITV